MLKVAQGNSANPIQSTYINKLCRRSFLGSLGFTYHKLGQCLYKLQFEWLTTPYYILLLYYKSCEGGPCDVWSLASDRSPHTVDTYILLTPDSN